MRESTSEEPEKVDARDIGRGRYRLYCYGKLYAEVGGQGVAFAAAEDHIRNCPEGAMPWASPIRWREVNDPADPPRSWMSSARGEWLSHRIDECLPGGKGYDHDVDAGAGGDFGEDVGDLGPVESAEASANAG